MPWTVMPTLPVRPAPLSLTPERMTPSMGCRILNRLASGGELRLEGMLTETVLQESGERGDGPGLRSNLFPSLLETLGRQDCNGCLRLLQSSPT